MWLLSIVPSVFVSDQSPGLPENLGPAIVIEVTMGVGHGVAAARSGLCQRSAAAWRRRSWSEAAGSRGSCHLWCRPSSHVAHACILYSSERAGSTSSLPFEQSAPTVATELCSSRATEQQFLSLSQHARGSRYSSPPWPVRVSMCVLSLARQDMHLSP